MEYFIKAVAVGNEMDADWGAKVRINPKTRNLFSGLVQGEWVRYSFFVRVPLGRTVRVVPAEGAEAELTWVSFEFSKT